MTHPPSWRSRDTGNEADNRLASSVVALQKVRRVFFRRPSNLTNHDNTVCFLVLQEHLETIDEVGTRERVTANANDERLTESSLSSLVDGFVGQSSGARDNANAAALVDETWHDANLALALYTTSEGTLATSVRMATYRSNNARAIGAHKPRLALRLENIRNANHVMLWDTLGDTHNQRYLSRYSFLDSLGS